jgi:uncharacterized protein YrrD
VDNIENIDKLIGRAVVSLETANKLGRVADVLTDPLSGELAGFAVKRLDETDALVSILDIHGIGRDAIVADGDHSLVLVEASPLNALPRGKGNLIGVKVITEHGQLLGRIAKLFLCIDRRPVFIYEVRSMLWDKLLGRSLYFAASLSRSFAADRSALVVAANPEQMDRRVNEAADRLRGPYGSSRHPAMAVHVEVRSH